ncbi:hypothetical protein ThvES_00019520 [Thiovulum sp. ES]|nr:hypothetical protein ThvES_00019520 [Thiovulum sp. ES]
MKRIRKYKKYSRLSDTEKEFIYRSYGENVGQRALSRILKVSLSTIQYHYKKMRIFKEKFEEFMSSIKGRTFFAYLIIDDLYTFYKKKSQKVYVWSAIAVDIEGNQHYFYHLSEKKDNKALLEFKEKLPNVEIVFCDGNVSYNSVFVDKATMKKICIYKPCRKP